MDSARDSLRKALAIKSLASLSSASHLSRKGIEHAAASASRAFYAALQGVACAILGNATIQDDEILAGSNGKEICRTNHGRWSFAHGTTVKHSDLVLHDVKDRMCLKAMESVRNEADYQEATIPMDDVIEQIADAKRILKALGLDG